MIQIILIFSQTHLQHSNGEREKSHEKLNIHAWMPLTNSISSLFEIDLFFHRPHEKKGKKFFLPTNTRMSFNFQKLCKNDNSHRPRVVKQT